ncbi:MAG: glycosyltransferase [Candidatus Omnitrophica bacterium]|nr:glycosyltransferase [Candidatus Omnitrophota bacterium]
MTIKEYPITVLMTVYNAEKYLPQSIESVFHQTFQDFEFLIIDDASKDKSVEVIQSYKDERIVLHKNKENLGQTRSLNLGFQLAKGHYIARMDADDIAFSHWLQSQTDFLKKNGEYDILSSRLATFSNKSIQKVYFSPAVRDDILLRAIVNSPINHGSSLMKRETVLAAGGYNNDYKIAADYGLWVTLMSRGAKITSNSDILMAIRIHAQSASKVHQDNRSVIETSGIIRDHVHYVSNKEFTDEEIRLMCRAHYEEGSLSFDEFNRAIHIHKTIYSHLKDELLLSPQSVSFWYYQQAKTFFLRRINFYILNKNKLEVRKTARAALKVLGFNLNFFLLFILSWLPQSLLQFVSRTYLKMHALKAMFCLRKTSHKILNLG